MKALGPDEFHPTVLKKLAPELGPIFAHRDTSICTSFKFQQSSDSGESPKNGL